MRSSSDFSVVVEDLLVKFRQDDAIETPHARFSTRVPSMASEGYLNVVFKPLPRDVIVGAVRELNIPPLIERFLQYYNGVRLFFDQFCVYGLVDNKRAN